MAEASGTFTITGMAGEDELGTADGVRLTHAAGDQSFDGDIFGRGHVDWLFAYRPDRTAELVGLQRIEGTLEGRQGTFVLTSTGSHDGQTSNGRWTIVAGSGSGELATISGDGDWSAGPGPQATWRLRYELG
ncbi:MAG TPA: DUF3224 domain-containing protein [Candidatus Limnocylindrales bacterium]